MTSSPPASSFKPSPIFATTRWSLVLQAQDHVAPGRTEALADLCRAYWFPLYAFIRKRSRDAHEAQDLTQSFFVRLMEKDFFDSVDPARGRFRSFLLAAVKNFVTNEWDKLQAIKRGGGARPMSLDHVAFDWELGESRFLTEPSYHLTAERIFERQWALSLLERVLMLLRDEYATAGKTAQFDILQPFLSVHRDSAKSEDIATKLGITNEAARVAVHRIRKRYRQKLRDEIARTVASDEDVDDEIRHLFQAVSSDR